MASKKPFNPIFEGAKASNDMKGLIVSILFGKKEGP